MDTSNKYMVGSTSGGMVRIALPPTGFMTAEEAVVLAAWLVEMAECSAGDEFKFDAVREAVQNS